VIEARSGSEALARLAEVGSFDLLVTDHLMPGGTGVDLAREAAARQPDLPVSSCQGIPMRCGVPLICRASKPLRQADLLAALTKVLDMANVDHDLRAEIINKSFPEGPKERI
jgi:DNA-binding NtrC family response regulator